MGAPTALTAVMLEQPATVWSNTRPLRLADPAAASVTFFNVANPGLLARSATPSGIVTLSVG